MTGLSLASLYVVECCRIHRQLVGVAVRELCGEENRSKKNRVCDERVIESVFG